MPAKRRPSDDPAERERELVATQEAYQAALDQNAMDEHAGRIPMFGRGALVVLAKRLEDARAAVAELAEAGPGA